MKVEVRQIKLVVQNEGGRQHEEKRMMGRRRWRAELRKRDAWRREFGAGGLQVCPNPVPGLWPTFETQWAAYMETRRRRGIASAAAADGRVG